MHVLHVLMAQSPDLPSTCCQSQALNQPNHSQAQALRRDLLSLWLSGAVHRPKVLATPGGHSRLLQLLKEDARFSHEDEAPVVLPCNSIIAMMQACR